MSSQKKQKSDHEGFFNPFHPAPPRIPDGAVPASLSHRYRQVVQYDIAPNRVLHILMYPGLHGGMVYGESLSSLQGVISTTYRSDRYSDTQTRLSGNLKFTVGAGINQTDSGQSLNSKLTNVGDISKWRLVSQGLRISHIDTDQNNDGWFQSVRYTTKKGNNKYRIILPNNTHAFSYGNGEIQLKEGTGHEDQACIVPKKAIFAEIQSDRNLPEQKGYVSAPLKMIGGAMFKLHPHEATHEFIEFQSNHQLAAGTFACTKNFADADEDPITEQVEGVPEHIDIVAGVDTGHDLIDEAVDSTFEYQYIRIYGGVNGSKIVMDLTANHEIVYDEESVLHKHMQPLSYDPKFERKKNNSLLTDSDMLMTGSGG